MRALLQGVVAAGAWAIAIAANAQPMSDHGHAMPKQTLLTARATSAEVVSRGAAASDATATGAFVIAADGKSIAYRVTWDGLSAGAATRVDVHNFGRGGTGSTIATLCGRDAAPCPDGRGGTIEGRFDIDPKMLRELAVERTYVDVHTAGAQGGEVRGQILALPWMVHGEQYIGRFKNGTATLYVTPFPQGTQVQVDITVAGLPGGPASVEVRRGDKSLAGRWPVDGGALRRVGGTISGILPAASRLAPLGPDAVRALQARSTTISVVVNRKTVAVGTLEAVK